MVSLQYLVKRTLVTIFMLWLVLTILFLVFKSLPGSYLDILRARGIPEVAIEQIARDYQLNEPLHVQYIAYLRSVLQGNWGVSLRTSTPVVSVVAEKIFRTFILVGPGITTAYILGAIYGTLAGTSPGSLFEKVGVIPVIMVGSVPGFVSSIFLIIIFSGILGLFPPSGMISTATLMELADAPWWQKYFTFDFLTHYILPFTAVVFRYLYYPSLVMRNSITEVMNQDFVFFNRMTGIPRSRQLRHIARHASLPLVTIYPISLSRSIGGLVLIETVFNWPGVGAELVQAVMARDFPVVIFLFFLIASFIIIANFLIDILYGILDPRVTVE